MSSYHTGTQIQASWALMCHFQGQSACIIAQDVGVRAFFSFILGSAKSDLHWSDEVLCIHGMNETCKIWMKIHLVIQKCPRKSDTISDFVAFQQFHPLEKD
jgi:hypothetical protein